MKRTSPQGGIPPSSVGGSEPNSSVQCSRPFMYTVEHRLTEGHSQDRSRPVKQHKGQK
ncbi:hypothetical protein INR49_026507 [Caranx melampygus]|nr:hypothetical protein INR49_026507 [Caranx melampygus]